MTPFNHQMTLVLFCVVDDLDLSRHVYFLWAIDKQTQLQFDFITQILTYTYTSILYFFLATNPHPPRVLM